MASSAPNPVSVGIIMDGNRRYAKERGLPTLEGHRAGSDKLREVMRWAVAADIKEVVVYAFSTENWNRSVEEVGYLMDLFAYAFTKWIAEFEKEGIRIRFIGERERAPEKVQKIIKDAEERTKNGAKATLAIAFSYGGRAEIVDAVNTLLAQGKVQITEEQLKEAMWTCGLHDPDLIIRTSGEQRLSNFLPWQSVYSELFFTKTLWPAFTEEEFNAILAEYRTRERRHGK